VQRDLVMAARHGDHEAFEALAVGVADRLYGIARLILRDTYLAQDAVQETLVRAWRQLPTLRDPERFDAWLRRLLISACADEGRQARRRSPEIHVVVDVEPSVGDDTGWVADRDLLERGFRRLRPEHRAALVLHFYVGLPASEVADSLGVPEGTAKSRIHYATQALRAALDADAREAGVATNGRSA
jgi:RNA polymerase sigma-70 factor, ECF subfamily